MNGSKLIASLIALNLGVLAWVLFKPSPPAKNEFPSDLKPVRESSGRVVLKKPETQSTTTPAATPFHWRQLESEDYRTYIQRLRSIGCPEQTIRDIIIADVEKLMAPRLAATMPRSTELKYWHAEEEDLWHNLDQRQALQKQLQIEHEKREVILELIGADLVAEKMAQAGTEDYYSRRLSFLPESKRSKLRILLEKFEQAESAIREKEWEEGETLSEEDRKELLSLHQERNAQVARLLSLQELEQFELWFSPPANTVRHAVFGMNASEAEFLSLYQLRKSFEENWPFRDSDNPTFQQASQDLESSIEKELGSHRYADYVRGQDPDFRVLSRTVARYKLPKETAAQVYDFKLTLQEQQQKVLSDPGLDSEKKEATVTALSREAGKIVGEMLGEKGFNYYLRQGQGEWLRN